MPFRLIPSRDRKLNRAVRRAPARTFRKGSTLYRLGDPAAEAHLVEKGHLQLTLPRSGSAARATRTVAVIGPGELAGLECLEPDGRRRYTCVAGEATGTRVLVGLRLGQALQGTRWTLGMVFKSAHQDLALARSTVGGQSSHRTPGRLSRVLLDLADRFGVESEDGVHVPRWCTHQELADLSGAHRSTVTTLLNAWIYDGLVDERPGSLILRVRELQRKAAE